MRAPKANEKAVPRQGRRGRSFVDWLAVAAQFALPRSWRGIDPFETPRQMLERRCGCKLAYPKPRPPAGGMRRDQIQRRQKRARKRVGPNYAKEARHGERVLSKFRDGLSTAADHHICKLPPAPQLHETYRLGA